ncbi:hypothetical protein HMPREF1868_00533 [Olsenella sp. DNF00959]|nr:hypothetical protein HMPREF1868_00533 [Olsenella sp. DNF00959]
MRARTPPGPPFVGSFAGESCRPAPLPGPPGVPSHVIAHVGLE